MTVKEINANMDESEIRKRLVGKYLYTDGFYYNCVISGIEIDRDSPLLTSILGAKGFVIQKVKKIDEWGYHGLNLLAISQNSSLYGFISFLIGNSSTMPPIVAYYRWERMVFSNI